MTGAPRFDLQSHSTHSDGELPPAAVVARAAAAGVELLALTDHDTVDGVEEAVAAAAEHGIRLSPAVELSSVQGAHEDLHLLGYEIDHRDPVLLDRLREYREDRRRRIDRMAARLRDLGFELDAAALEERAATGASVGRPHLARAVLEHPANAQRLEQEGRADPDAFFPEYLVPGARAWVGRARPTVREAIGAVHDAGGVAVWAHPYWDLSSDREVLDTIDRFRGWGLDGVEVFYPAHSRAQVELLHDRCTALGLLITGSTDFHGPGHDRFSGFRGFELHGRRPVLGPIGAPGRQ
jgi:3',5'-nucleoside bisphosphate phosphatase